jgi:hypothetical protein
MRKTILPVLAGFAAAMMATPASAAEVLCFRVGNDTPQCAQTDTNVLLTGTTSNGAIETNFNGSGAVTGQFTSSTDTLIMGASGQAVVTAADNTLTQLTFQLLSSTFTTATFNLVGTGTIAFDGFVFGIGADGTDFVRAITTAGNSGLLGITGDAGERFTGFSLTATSGSLQAVEQVRLAGVQSITTAVPEPGTWAMMLVGFGGIGVTMRRRRRSGANLLQMA